MDSKQLRQFYNASATEREAWKEKHRYYHNDILTFIKSNISPEDSVLDIGCGIGDLIASLPCRLAVGLDFGEQLIKIARERNPDCSYFVGDANELPVNHTFDCVLLSDTIGLLPDVQKVFCQLKQVTASHSRIIITYHNYMWEPVLKFFEKLGFRMPQPIQNWLPLEDIQNLLYLAGFEVIKKGHRMLFPKQIRYVSTFLNSFVAKLPLIKNLCLVEWLIAKPLETPYDASRISCSVVIPCRNEKGNIADAVRRTPRMGRQTELIFVDGVSTDGTVEEILKFQGEYPDRNIKLIHQGRAGGKRHAVELGFDAAVGDVLMILDADLTVPPEDLPKFFNAIVEGKGEFINGTRLVYPMEKQAMRFLNMIGNKLFGLIFSYLLEQRISDTLCGTKALWRRSYVRIKNGRAYFGDFDPFGDFDLLFGACRQNLKVVELPVRYRDRVYGTTKIRRFAHGWLLLKMCWVATRKLKFA